MRKLSQPTAGRLRRGYLHQRVLEPLADKIIGARGPGDTLNSSNGVVAYWSSHLAGAKSERIVPSSHGANQNSEGIAEVARILKQHIGNKRS